MGSPMLSAYLANGAMVDLILLVMAVEFTVLSIRHRRRAAGGRRLDLLLALMPGMFILLALRAALTGAGAVWIALSLAASFPVHLLDLHRRGLLR